LENDIRIITLNVNGIRAAAKKGFFEWLQEQDADIVCLQEIRAQLDDIQSKMFWPEQYHCFYFPAEKKGYSGVAIFSKKKPSNVLEGLNSKEFDFEGRYLECVYDDFTIASVYFPSGSSGDIRQQMKYRFLDVFEDNLKDKLLSGKPYIFCGDVNIVHREIDIKNWKSNQKNSGCLPEERAWLDNIFDQLSFVDSFRVVNQNTDEYTWWSNRGRAWEKNVGWRIDYQITTQDFKNCVNKSFIFKNKRFSDHAPLVIDYDYPF